MTTSDSIPGTLVIQHEAGDTFRRLFTIDEGGVPVNFSGSTVEFLVSKSTHSAAIITGNAAIGSDLPNGAIAIESQTEGLLKPNYSYIYRLRVTFPSGDVRTYLEGAFKTK